MGSCPGQTRMAHGQQSGLTAAGLQVPWLFAGEWIGQAPDRPGSLVVESIEEQAGDHHGRDYLGMAVSTLEGTGNKEPGKLPSEREVWVGPSMHEVVTSIHLYILSLNLEKQSGPGAQSRLPSLCLVSLI